MDYVQLMREDARLVILKALAEQVDERLHSGFLQTKLCEFGIDRERAWVHSELDWLAEIGAVSLRKVGTVVVAELTEMGARHLRRSIAIPGISRPSRGGD